MTTPRLEPFRPTPRERTVPPALRDPVRLAAIVAAAGLFLGSLLNWINVFLPGYGWQEVSSFAREGDGAIALVLGIVLFGLTWADRTATSRIPVVVVAPLVLGLASLAVVKLGFDTGQDYLAGLAGAGGHGYWLPGFYIALAGALLAVVAGFAHVIRLRREVEYSVAVSSATAVSMVSGLVGALVGIGAAIVLGETFGSNATISGSAVTFLSIVFGLVGAWLGARIGRSFAGPGFED